MRARAGHAPRGDLGEQRLYHGGLSPASGRTNPGAEGKGHTGATSPARSLTLSCTRGLGATMTGPRACARLNRRGLSLQEQSLGSLVDLKTKPGFLCKTSVRGCLGWVLKMEPWALYLLVKCCH